MTARTGRWFAFGARLAVLAVLTQAIVPTIHHIWHGYPPIAAAAMAAAADRIDTSAPDCHEHDPAKNPSPSGDSKTPPICPVCQSAQQLIAGLPPPAAAVPVQLRQGRTLGLPRDAAAISARPSSSAQPRAPPATA